MNLSCEQLKERKKYRFLWFTIFKNYRKLRYWKRISS